MTKSTHVLFILFLSFSIFNSFFSFAMLLFALYVLLLFIFRRTPDALKESFGDISDASLFSPISGRVISIKENVQHKFFGESYTRIHLVLPLLREIGISLPLTSEVIDKRIKEGTSLFRYDKKSFNSIEERFESIDGVSLILQTLKKDRIGLHLVKCKIGAFPELVVLPGDRGRRQVNIGNMPFGGSLLLYLPKKYNIVCKEGQVALAGLTILANDQEIN